MKRLTELQRRQTACEATVLLNEAIRELVIPRQIHALTETVPEGPVNIQWLSGVRHLVMQSVVLAIFRVWEVRKHFLVGWLFTDAELSRLKFPPLEEFIGSDRWSDFLIVRHNYAGHATAAGSTDRAPAKLVPGQVLGRALRRCGLAPGSQKFLERIVTELVPGIEATIADLRRRYPEVDVFLRETYPEAISTAMHKKEPE